MLDLKDFSFKESQNIFDLKGFLLKVAGYWKWIVACIIIFLFAAYQVNIRKEKVYALNSLIVIREESSPLLTSNTSLVFNWGGVSDKVQTVIATLKSRNHNELVVAELEYYIDYLIKDKYNYVDAYGRVPFKVNIDKTKPQLLNQLIGIKFISETEYELSVLFEEEEAKTISYVSESIESFPVEKTFFTKKYQVGEQVVLPFINWKLQLGDTPFDFIGKEYFVSFRNFNSVVASYQNISASPNSKTGGSILKLELEGTNKKRIVEYLNTTVDMLRENQLESKNIFAVNTIRFIDSTLARLQDENTKTSSSLMDFMKDKNVYEISEQGEGMLMSRLVQYDVDKELVLRKI